MAQETHDKAHNASGYKRVTKCGDKWQVRFNFDRKTYYGGIFDTVEEAVHQRDLLWQKLIENPDECLCLPPKPRRVRKTDVGR